MYDVVTIGSSLVDMFIHSHEFMMQSAEEGVLLCQRYGDKIEVDSMVMHTGGGGGNTAVGFARAGFHTAVISETGRDTLANIVLADFRLEKVDTSYIIRERKEQTGGSVILVGSDGGRTVLVHRGAAAQLGPEDLTAPVLSAADWIHVSSLAGQLDTIERIAQIRGQRTRLSWNPGKAELQLLTTRQLRIAHFPVTVLICNAEEWLLLEEMHEEVLAAVSLIVITNGKYGGQVYQANLAPFHFDSAAVTAVDETGAGDAFCVGLVSGLLWGLAVPKALQCAVTNATSVVRQTGAKPGLLGKQQLLGR